jgi:hypothetical protein
MTEFLSVAEVLQAKCGRRPGFGDKAAPQEEQGGVAADPRVRTESSDTRGSTSVGFMTARRKFMRRQVVSLSPQCVLFLRVIPNALAEVKSAESGNRGAYWRISKV